MDQKGAVLGPFLARFSIRGHDPDPLGVSSDLKNGQFWSEISESTNPHFSEKFRLKQKFWMGGQPSPPIVKLCHMVHFQKWGGIECPPPAKIFIWAKKKYEKWGIWTFRYTGSKSAIFEVWTDL